MEDLINQIKLQNGNKDFTQKDLIWYLVAKIDKVDSRLTLAVDKKLDKSTFLWAIGITLSAFIAFMGFVSKVLKIW